MAKFMEIKSINPKLNQSEKAKELAISTSTLQRYSGELNMHSPLKIIQSTKVAQENKRLQTILSMTSRCLQMT